MVGRVRRQTYAAPSSLTTVRSPWYTELYGLAPRSCACDSNRIGRDAVPAQEVVDGGQGGPQRGQACR